MERDTTDVLLELLRSAADAHGKYEAEVLDGVYDDEWPAWYAAHMTEHLSMLGYRLVSA